MPKKNSCIFLIGNELTFVQEQSKKEKSVRNDVALYAERVQEARVANITLQHKQTNFVNKNRLNGELFCLEREPHSSSTGNARRNKGR